MFNSLIGSRRFWIAIVALLVNALSLTVAPPSRRFVEAVNEFAPAWAVPRPGEESGR